MKTIYKAVPTLAAFAVFLLFVAGFMPGSPVGSKDTFWIQGTGCLQVCHADGTCEEPSCAINKVTEGGLNWTRDALSGLGNFAATNNWTFIELSTNTSTPLESESACPDVVTYKGLNISIADNVVRGVAGNFTINKTWAVTGTQTGIIKLCISNSSASGSSDLKASVLVDSTNVISGDTLIGSYSLAVGNA